MDKEKFLTTMQDERERWIGLFQEIEPSLLNRPGVAGGWTVVDLLGHVSAYERGLVEWLQAALRGEVASFPVLDHPDVDYRNELIYQENRGRSFVEVLQESQADYIVLLDLVRALCEQDLLDEQRTRWFVEPRWRASRPLWECIADDSYRHYRQHRADLKAWLERMKSGDQV